MGETIGFFGMVGLLAVLAIAAICCIGYLLKELAWLIYRSVVYTYTKETLFARVNRKECELSHLEFVGLTAVNVPRFTVHFTMRNGIVTSINDEQLYHWAEKGSTFTVTMKIGRDRNGTIQYWRVVDSHH